MDDIERLKRLVNDGDEDALEELSRISRRRMTPAFSLSMSRKRHESGLDPWRPKQRPCLVVIGAELTMDIPEPLEGGALDDPFRLLLARAEMDLDLTTPKTPS